MKNRTYRYMKNKAQFPFGYGLNYGDVHMVEGKRLEEGRKVSVVLENRGCRDTDEVVQVYIKHETSEFAADNPMLCAFRRVHIKAGEILQVELELEEKRRE